MVISKLGKQALGAGGGMAVAALLFVAVQQVSLSNIKGYLIDSTPGSTVDTSTTQADLAQNAEARKAARVEAQSATSSSVPSYLNTGAVNPTTKETRLAQKTAATIAAMEAGHAGAPIYQPVQTVVTPVQPEVQIQYVPGPTPPPIIKEVRVEVPTEPKVIIKEVRVPAPQQTIIREVQVQDPAPAPKTITRHVQYGKNLPDSGPVLTIALLLSALGALATLRPELKQRFIASLTKGF